MPDVAVVNIDHRPDDARGRFGVQGTRVDALILFAVRCASPVASR